MGKGLIVFALIVIVSVVIAAVSQMMKNVQAPPPPRRGRQPQTDGDEIDKFLEEIDRLRKKKEGGPDPSGGPPVARPVARAARPKPPPPPPPARPATAADRAPTHRTRASDGAAFVPSRVTKAQKGPTQSLVDADPAAGKPAPVDAVLGGRTPRLEELPVAPPLSAKRDPVPTKTGIDKDISNRGESEFARKLVELLGGKHGMPLAIAMQEILNPPKSQRRGRPGG